MFSPRRHRGRTETSRLMTQKEIVGWKDAWTLEDYVRALLKDGKRSQHPDFQALFVAFGRDRVIEIAKRLLEAEKASGIE